MGVQIEENNKHIIIGQPKNKGIVVMPLELDFGVSHQVIELEKTSNFKALLGYSLEEDQMILLKEVFKGSDKVLVYRLNLGTYATYTTSHLKIIARYPGIRGNDLSVKIIHYSQWQAEWGQAEWGQVSKSTVQEDGGQVSKSVVVTLLAGEVVDFQMINEWGEIRDNAYVRFEGDISGELEEKEFILSGGENYGVSSKEWDEFFETIRKYEWRVMALTIEDLKVKKAVTKFIEELREVEGRSVYGVMANYSEANCMGIISIANGVKLKSGRILKRNECTAWMAGKVACAKLKETDETNIYEEAVEIDKKLNRAQINKLIKQGQVVFTKIRNRVEVVEDINTFKKFTPKWGVAYRQNAFVRMVDIMREDIHRLMKIYYLGRIRQGRSVQESKMYFKEICIKYIQILQVKGVVYEVDVAKDLDVFLAEDMEGIDVSLILKSSEIEDKTYVGILYNKLIS